MRTPKAAKSRTKENADDKAQPKRSTPRKNANRANALANTDMIATPQKQKPHNQKYTSQSSSSVSLPLLAELLHFDYVESDSGSDREMNEQQSKESKEVKEFDAAQIQFEMARRRQRKARKMRRLNYGGSEIQSETKTKPTAKIKEVVRVHKHASALPSGKSLVERPVLCVRSVVHDKLPQLSNVWLLLRVFNSRCCRLWPRWVGACVVVAIFCTQARTLLPID